MSNNTLSSSLDQISHDALHLNHSHNHANHIHNHGNNMNSNSNHGNGITIRCRTRKSPKAIDPEFGMCQETVVSFGNQDDKSRSKSGDNKNGKSKQSSSFSSSEWMMVLTPIPTPPMRSLSPLRGAVCPLPSGAMVNVNGGANTSSINGGNVSGRRRIPSVGSLGGSSLNGGVGEGREDGSGNDEVEQEGSESNQKEFQREGLPPKQQQHPNKRSIPLTRTPSAARSEPGLTNELNQSNHSNYSQARSTAQTTHTATSRDIRSRSLSRSRTRSRSRSNRGSNGGFLRKRSIGAHSAFADSPIHGCAQDLVAHGHHSIGGGDWNGLDESVRSSAGLTTTSLTRGTSVGSSASMGEEEMEPICIILKDVISVDQDVSSGSNDSLASSMVGSSIPPLPSTPVSIPPPPQPSASLSRKNSLSSTKYKNHCIYRIFVHSASHGYFEFSFDNSNSYDIMLAYLKAHLKDKVHEKSNDSSGSADENVEQGGAFQTMILTPSKIDRLSQPPLQYSESGQPASNSPKTKSHIVRSNSTQSSRTAQTTPSSQSVSFEKLQAKAFEQRLRQESTPLERMKENLSEWMSRIVDCACCQDTTTVASEDDASRYGNSGGYGTISSSSPGGKGGYVVAKKGSKSPMTEKLRRQGIGTLSLEEEEASVGRGHAIVSPKLSFEPSVCSKSSKR